MCETFAGFNRKVKNDKAVNIRINNNLTQRRLVLLKYARSRIKSGLLHSFTEEEIKDGLKDNHNIFAYANIQSDLRVRVRGTVQVFNSITELDKIMALAFPTIATIVAGGASEESSSSRFGLRSSGHPVSR